SPGTGDHRRLGSGFGVALEVAVDRRAGGVEGADGKVEGGCLEFRVVRVTGLLQEVGALEEDVAEAAEVERALTGRRPVGGQLQDVHGVSVLDGLTTERRHCTKLPAWVQRCPRDRNTGQLRWPT